MTTRQIIKTNTIPTIYTLYKKDCFGKINLLDRNISSAQVMKMVGDTEVVWFRKNFTDDRKGCSCQIIVGKRDK